MTMLAWISCFLAVFPPPPRLTLFPYTTLFRSPIVVHERGCPIEGEQGAHGPCFVVDAERHRQRNTGRGHPARSEEHTSELQSHSELVCRLLLEKKKKNGRPSERSCQPSTRRAE